MFPFYFTLNFKRTLFIWEREKRECVGESRSRWEREKQAPHWAGCPTEAASQGPGIMPWAEGRHSTSEPPRYLLFLKFWKVFHSIYIFWCLIFFFTRYFHVPIVKCGCTDCMTCPLSCYSQSFAIVKSVAQNIFMFPGMSLVVYMNNMTHETIIISQVFEPICILTSMSK